MDVLTRNDLAILARERKGLCVSLYLPTRRAGQDIQQGPIRLKNLLGEARENLLAGGLRTPAAKQLLDPAHRLLRDGLFWQNQSNGLAIFLANETFRYYRLPNAFEELVVVTQRFHVKPLIGLLSGDGRFYVLALSQNKARLLQGTRYSVNKVNLEGVPTSLAEALRYDDPEKRLQFHTSTLTPGGRAERPAAFHGHGTDSNDTKARILRYFHRLDAGLQRLIRGERVPLILAGVSYLLPIYKEANTYPHLVDGGIDGNPEEMSAEELHKYAWAILHPRFLAAQREAAARYRQLTDAGSRRVSNDLKDIAPGAYHGRIETLFVAVGIQRWGTFDAGNNVVQLQEEATPGCEDLLDLAAVQTLLNRGTVYAVESASMPDDAPLAAVYRY
jgi:hypothetical protein